MVDDAHAVGEEVQAVAIEINCRLPPFVRPSSLLQAGEVIDVIEEEGDSTRNR